MFSFPLTSPNYSVTTKKPPRKPKIETEPFPRGTQVKRAVAPDSYHSGAKSIMLTLKALDQPQLQAPLQRITNTLTSKNNLKHEASVKPSGILKFNAMAIGSKELHNLKFMPIGFLKAVKSPEELAFTMGHELNHIQHQDGTAKVLRLIARPYISVLAALITAVGCLQYNKRHKNKQSAPFKPFEVFSVAAAGILTFLALSRLEGHLGRLREFRCDKYALQYLQKAGFSTKGYKTFFENAAKEELTIKGGENLGILPHQLWLKQKLEGISHPIDKKRIAAIEAYLKEHPDGPNTIPVMSEQEWRKFKQDVDVVFRQLEQERGQELMNLLHLDLDVKRRPPGKKQPPPYNPN